MVELNKTLELGWEEEEVFFIVFLAGEENLPVGPRAHGLSQPCAHWVLREVRGTPCGRGSKDPARTGYSES